MRPNKFWTETYKAIQHRLKTGSNEKFTPYLRKRMEKEIRKLNKDICRLCDYKLEPDLRSGEETYGYKTKESIENNLMYISDRFNAPYRLRWLLDGLEKGYI